MLFQDALFVLKDIVTTQAESYMMNLEKAPYPCGLPGDDSVLKDAPRDTTAGPPAPGAPLAYGARAALEHQ